MRDNREMVETFVMKINKNDDDAKEEKSDFSTTSKGIETTQRHKYVLSYLATPASLTSHLTMHTTEEDMLNRHSVTVAIKA